MSEKATDYALANHEADCLRGAVLLPHEFRVMALDKYRREHGGEALVNLFSQFIGMANSVVENGRDFLETAAIVHGDMHPYQVEKLNLPTVFGALNGVPLANGTDQKRTCKTCAYRHGTPANQSPSTTCDAEYVEVFDEVFMCHEGIPENGKPVKVCAGYAQKHSGSLTHATDQR